jgi:HlyD family secretion protein
MKKVIIVVVVVAVLVGAGYFAYQGGYLPPSVTQALRLPPPASAAAGAGTAAGATEDAAATTGDAEGSAAEEPDAAAESAAFAGRVVADAKVVPIQRSDLSMPISGIAQEVPVQEGDQVAKGALLVKLDDALQRVAVAQAEASLARAQANLDKLLAGARTEDISAAEAVLAAAQSNYEKLLNAAGPGNIRAAEAGVARAQAELNRVLEGASEQAQIAARADVASAEAQLNQARSAYNKVKDQADVGMLPQSLAMQQATIAYEAAQARYDDVLNGATDAQISSAQAAVAQAVAQLRTLQDSLPNDVAAALAQVQQAQAQVDALKVGARTEDIAAGRAEVAAATAQLQQALVGLSNTELRAPFTGVIATLNAALGEQVAPSLPVVQLADTTAFEIETSDLTELDVVNVRPGDPVLLTFDAVPDLELPGTVSRVRPIGQDNRGDTVYTVVIAPDRQDERLLWNMTAVVEFLGSSDAME